MARHPRSSTMRREHKYRATMTTMATLRKIRVRGPHERAWDGSRSYIHDMSSPSYHWLLPGWLAEERVLANGRAYKYYYDPNGHQYTAKYEVLYHWNKLGVVVLDA